MPAGRPTEYSDEIAQRICDAVSVSKHGLRKTLEDDKTLPPLSTVQGWLRNYAQFSSSYAQAKRLQLELLAEDIVDISLDDSLEANDKRVRIDAIKWLLSKLIPKTYGDKLDLTSDGAALSVSPAVIDARVNAIILAAHARKQHTIEGSATTLSDNALKLLE